MSQAVSAEQTYRASCLKYLENLVANRNFVEAIKYFESLAGSVISDTDIESGMILRLAANAYGSSNQFPKALQLIRSAIAVISNASGEADQLAECYMILGNLLRDMGNYDEAVRSFRDAESIFRRNGNISGTGRALNRLAGVHFFRGDLNRSLEYLLNAVESAKGAGDKKRLAYLFGNIGRVYTLLGKLGQAEDNIRMNIELSHEFDNDTDLARAYLSLGYIQTQQGKFDSASMSLDRGYEYIRSNRMNREEVMYFTYAGELAIKEGRLDEAEKTLIKAFAQGSRIASQSFLSARPLRHLAEVSLARGNYRKALATANKAMVMFRKLDDAVEIGALTRIVAECQLNLGNVDSARESYRRAINILEDCQAGFELAETLAKAGVAEIFTSGQKMMYLCRAEDRYHKCGLESQALGVQKLIGDCEIAAPAVNESQANMKADEFPTKNERMKQVIRQMHLLRHTDIPILLTGETGSGKDYLAQYFHSITRPDKPYVAINCAALPETLIESELFGHNRGAFTGADTSQPGLFVEANGGVLLLDEIGELPLMLQAKLLNVIESRRLRPLGSTDEIKLDIIIIAATNRNLADMVEAGTFRRDLYYRLAGVTFELPPLRERKEDIPQLLELFMRRRNMLNGNGPEPELVQRFVEFDWPGNVRQLENRVKQLAALSSMAQDGSYLELARSFFEEKREEETRSLFERVEQFEKRLLTEALVTAGGNKSQAARLLNIHESTFRAKMKRYGLSETLN